MADTAKKEDKVEESKPVADAADSSTNLETTTTNDSSLAINQEAPAAAPAAPEAEPKAENKTPSTDATEDTLIQTPTQPVVVSDADVAAAEKEADPHQSLAEQIEVLTGEVQALEAKIERLTNGVGEAPVPIPVEKPADNPVVPIPPAPEVAETPVPEVEKQPEPVTPTVQPQAAAMPDPAPKATTPVNDIYDKLLNTPAQTPSPTHKDLNDDTTIEEGTSGIGTIGEVLIVFGIIAFVILGASPFFKSMIGTNWEALKSIGWPTATISLALGFLLFLFNKGRLVFKIFALLLTLVAAIMTAAVFDYGSMLGPLSNLLDPIASFYK
jgi:hypothetical protein